MTRYRDVQDALQTHPRTWLVTGAAGFIGSNVAERLLSLGQTVVGVDNFATGYRHNLDDIRQRVGAPSWSRFHFIEGDIRDVRTCQEACTGAEIVVHQAALGSVPRSIANPVATHQTNVDGFLNMLVAVRDAGVRRFVFASSSSVYGDHPELPKVEDRIGRQLSPYAVSKYTNELYAHTFARCYGINAIGLRYFNVFGRRQDPSGGYAAVVPRWIGALLRGAPCQINGDGQTSRDFCYIENTVQATLLAAAVDDADATNQIYNVACGERTTLDELFAMIRAGVSAYHPDAARVEPVYGAPRPGDVRHSQADITKIRSALGYAPSHSVAQGLQETIEWYAHSEHLVSAL